MKIYPLRHGVSFHPSLSFFLSVKRCEKISIGVDQDIAHTYYISHTPVLTCNIISNAPADNYQYIF